MKPPHLLLAALLAATAVRADPPSGARCDVEWLERTLPVVSRTGGAVADERVEIADNRFRLKFGDPRTCDAAAWRQLATREASGDAQPRWRNPAAGVFWSGAAAGPQIGLVLVVSDFYGAFDPKAVEALAAADRVIDAALQLGLVEVEDSTRTLAQRLPPGGSGGAIGALRPRTVTPLEAGRQRPAAVAMDRLGETMRKLIEDAGDAAAPGGDVLSFRQAVLGLAVELERLGRSNAAVSRRLGAGSALKDFVPGLPQGFQSVPANRANALDAAKYASALAALTGAGAAPALDDMSPRAGSLLEPVDVGLRNLLAIRAAQIERIMALARARLGGKTIAQLETAARMAGRIAEGGVDPNSLAAAALRQLAASSDYASLETLYENRRRRADGEAWLQSADGRRVQEALEQMRAAAASARVESVDGRPAASFTVNGQRRVFRNVPGNVATDQAARDFTGDQVAELIVRGSRDEGKLQAALAAVRGLGEEGRSMEAGLTLDQRALAQTLAASRSEAPLSAWDRARRSPQAGCGSPSDAGRSEMTRIAARLKESAGDRAAANSRSRAGLQRELNSRLDGIRRQCVAQEAGIASRRFSAVYSTAAVANERRNLVAALRERCNAAIAAARERVVSEGASRGVLTSEEEGESYRVALSSADAEVSALYDSGIEQALAQLEAWYSTKGDPHRRVLLAATGFSEDVDGEHAINGIIARYFAEHWRGDGRQAAYDDCKARLGYRAGLDPRSMNFRNPEPDPDANGLGGVDINCGVRGRLVAALRAQRGTLDVVTPARDPVELDGGGGSLDELLRQRRAQGSARR